MAQESVSGAIPPWLRQGADRAVGAGGNSSAPAAATPAPAAVSAPATIVADAPPTAPAKKKKTKLLAIIHMEGCTGCDVCIEFCPVDCMYHIPGPEHILATNPHAAVNGVVIIDETVCIGCKLCAKYCPWETIEMIDSDDLDEARSLGLTY